MYIVQHQFFAEALTGIKTCYAVAGESQRHQCGPGGWRAGLMEWFCPFLTRPLRHSCHTHPIPAVSSCLFLPSSCEEVTGCCPEEPPSHPFLSSLMGGNVSPEAGALCHTAASVPSVSQSSAGPHQGLLVLLCLPPALPLLLPSLVAV